MKPEKQRPRQRQSGKKTAGQWPPLPVNRQIQRQRKPEKKHRQRTMQSEATDNTPPTNGGSSSKTRHPPGGRSEKRGGEGIGANNSMDTPPVAAANKKTPDNPTAPHQRPRHKQRTNKSETNRPPQPGHHPGPSLLAADIHHPRNRHRRHRPRPLQQTPDNKPTNILRHPRHNPAQRKKRKREKQNRLAPPAIGQKTDRHLHTRLSHPIPPQSQPHRPIAGGRLQRLGRHGNNRQNNKNTEHPQKQHANQSGDDPLRRKTGRKRPPTKKTRRHGGIIRTPPRRHWRRETNFHRQFL